ncbi:hypothetical protein MTO96_027078 [Rhipicephalus appendiculatus]
MTMVAHITYTREVEEKEEVERIAPRSVSAWSDSLRWNLGCHDDTHLRRPCAQPLEHGDLPQQSVANRLSRS